MAAIHPEATGRRVVVAMVLLALRLLLVGVHPVPRRLVGAALLPEATVRRAMAPLVAAMAPLAARRRSVVVLPHLRTSLVHRRPVLGRVSKRARRSPSVGRP